MKKLEFPTDILPGLVFNDFINKESLLHTYAPFAIQIKKVTQSYSLIMDDNGEVIHIDHQNTIPEWVAYEVHRKASIAKLNHFIFSSMTCTMKEKDQRLFKHASGLWVHIQKGENNIYTYLVYHNISIES